MGGHDTIKGQPVQSALEILGHAIDRLETALSGWEARTSGTVADASAETRRREEDLAALRGEYEILRDEYGQLRHVVEKVDGRLDGTVNRLRAMLEG